MTNGSGPDLSERVAQRGGEVVVARLRDAFAHQTAARDDGLELDATRLERMIREAAANAGEALWRRSLAEAVMEELGIDLRAALAHPALAHAQALVKARDPALAADALPGPASSAEDQPAHGVELPEAQPSDRNGALPAPSHTPVTDPHALCLSVVHLSGIETLPEGDDDLEVRLSDAGLDVLRRSSGTAIGRLEWSEINSVVLPGSKRGLRRRRSRELHVSTGRGRALFGLPGLTDEELHEQLEPALARLTGDSTDVGATVHARPVTGAAADQRDSHPDSASSPAEAYS